MEAGKRFKVALAVYCVLGVLIWATIDDLPLRISGGQISLRTVTLAIWLLFVLRTLLHWKAEQVRAQERDGAERGRE